MLSLLGSLRRGNFVQNSLRFRSSASAYLSRTPGVSGNQTTWTWSAWVKRGALGINGFLIGAGASTSNEFAVYFDSTDNLHVYQNTAGSIALDKKTTQVFRDPSAWYHIAIVLNSTSATAEDRAQIWINGSRVTSWATNTIFNQNTTTFWNANTAHSIGNRSSTPAAYFDGYITEVNFIDGQALTPSSFGQIESTTGVWSPKQYAGSYGTNGFYLKFGNTSSVAALGTDSSGNGNTWTVNSVSLTAGATYDSMIDVPVNYADGGNGRGNYAVWNAVGKTGSAATTDGNLGNSFTSSSSDGVLSSIAIDAKAYAEFYGTAFGSAVRYTGVSESVTSLNNVLYFSDGRLYFNNVLQGTFATYTSADIVSVDCDPATRQARVYKNNTQISTTATISGTLPLFFIAGGSGGGTGSSTGGANFGQRPFAYTPPAGFRALNTNNLPTPSIVNGANFMAATTYTGNAAARSLSNAVNSVSFQPDLVWIKSRTPGATSHALFDSTRGTGKYLSSDTTAAETTNANSLTAFNGDGFSLGTDTTIVNANANSYIAWQWRESITAGLDVVSYAGTGVNRTVAHNLGVAPAMVIVKRSQTGATSNWQVRHTSIAAANSIQLNSTNQAAAAATVWNSTAPTSSVFSLGTSTDVNASGVSYVAYCFAEIAGFSRFGSYTGNGSADGPFVFCGFRPRFVMVKRTDVAASWVMFDSSRNPSNLTNLGLIPNDPAVEFTGTGTSLDILSNGIKARGAGAELNVSAATYIFAAFAEVPSKYALAR
jgi:hypothetical protein